MVQPQLKLLGFQEFGAPQLELLLRSIGLLNLFKVLSLLKLEARDAKIWRIFKGNSKSGIYF
jgi:hypothetical protein